MAGEKNASEKVGYAKPPKSSQFKKGQSGNPKGRPKAPPKISDVFAREAARMVLVVEQGKKVKRTQLELVVRRTFVDAMQGRGSAARLVLEGMLAIPEAPEVEQLMTAHDLALLQKLLLEDFGQGQ